MKLNSRIKSLVKDAALKHAKNLKIDKTSNLHLHDEILTAGEKLGMAAFEVTLERDTALVFVDNAPICNWAHPCEYHLYDAVTAKLYQKVLASLPPSQLKLDTGVKTAFHEPVKLVDTKKRRKAWKKRLPAITNGPSASPGQRYAILFAGHANNRHTNDLEFLYRSLIDDYGFAAANIYVLNHDGTVNYYGASIPIGKWPGNNTAYRMQVTGAGTRAGFQAAFNAVAGRIKPEDFLFIHTNNHGGGPCDGVTDYCMFQYDVNENWIPYYVNDFISDMSVLPPFEVLMVMMEQCRSGGFINPIINNSPAKWTHVGTAVTANDYSLGGADFDPFAEDWIAGIHGSYPDGTGLKQTVDANNDGRISATEAFNYANAVHQYDGTIHRYCPPPNGTPLRYGDTPTVSESPANVGSYIFLGLPAHDLYLRDNLLDHGREPLVDGGISCSPDIIVFNQELLDPEATLATAAAQKSDSLGDQVESGQDNFIYLRVQNRGTQATSGTARLFWTNPSALPTPGSWTEITAPGSPIAIPSVGPNDMKIVGPIIWRKADIPGKGHYCFIGLINSGGDPAPNPATIHTIDDYYNFIRQSNNATWRNFDVVDVFANSMTSLDFSIQGWPRQQLAADLMIDLTTLPSTVQVKLKILKRLSSTATLQGATLTGSSATYQQFQLTAGEQVFLRNMNLRTSDCSQATLEITTPPQLPDGNYRLAVSEIIGGREMGRVTRMLAVGNYRYMGNSSTFEIHLADCAWTEKISPRHKRAYGDLDKAWKHGFDGCRYCLPEFSKD